MKFSEAVTSRMAETRKLRLMFNRTVHENNYKKSRGHLSGKADRIQRRQMLREIFESCAETLAQHMRENPLQGKIITALSQTEDWLSAEQLSEAAGEPVIERQLLATSTALNSFFLRTHRPPLHVGVAFSCAAKKDIVMLAVNRQPAVKAILQNAVTRAAGLK